MRFGAPARSRADVYSIFTPVNYFFYVQIAIDRIADPARKRV